MRDSDYADVRAQIERIFYEIIFKPVLDLLSPHNAQVKSAAREFRNAAPTNDAVIAAINNGRIQYADGVFSGDFNSVISRSLIRIGAKFSRTTKAFTLAPNLVPPDVRAAAKHYEDWAQELHELTQKRLDEIEAGLDQAVDKNQVNASVMVGRVQHGFEKSVGDALGNKELSDESRTKLKRQYADSLKPYIKKFSADTIRELREAVEVNALQGYRFDSLIKRVQNRYDVSKSKAEFLARTETSRYVSLHRKTRFEEAGITQYIWRTAGDARVREDHKKLNGQTFSYKNPPIIDESTGERGNPGMTYNCRCVDEPVIPDFRNYTTPGTRKNSKPLEAVTC